MKGLRPHPLCLFYRKLLKVRIDLIYEGIATVVSAHCIFEVFLVRIDLIYEGIATFSPSCRIALAIVVRIDLIYEGIATFAGFLSIPAPQSLSELT